ncbi:MAG: hypothetical protein GF416_03350 [Candidatus Altiarchaeales archaeon]|nr:hypothetical protein [Candidatus Altiarchaeales archaeon]MBD3416155.1 hypothetical protein [Candidatus Altiarchaeales archaeon]
MRLKITYDGREMGLRAVYISLMLFIKLSLLFYPFPPLIVAKFPFTLVDLAVILVLLRLVVADNRVGYVLSVLFFTVTTVGVILSYGVLDLAWPFYLIAVVAALTKALKK